MRVMPFANTSFMGAFMMIDLARTSGGSLEDQYMPS